MMLSNKTPIHTAAEPASPTSSLERILLALTIIALPADNHLIIFPGISVVFVLFGAIAVYIVAVRFSELLETLSHPALIAAYLFLFIGFVMELTQINQSYDELMRIAQMIVGAILVASLCRDLPALKMACYGYLAAGLWLSILLFMTSYGALNAATASNFHEASQLRAMAFEDNPLQANLNSMAFGAGQAAVVALAWALKARTSLYRNLSMGLGCICMVGAFLPLSRGGVAITIASCASVMYAFGLRQGKAVLIAVLLGGAVLASVPQSVWSRMNFTFEAHEGKVEGRARVLEIAIDHLPEYFLTGVGAGNFWTSWGRRAELASDRGQFGASHNCFLQVTLYWGVLGLTALLLVFWQAYRCIPRFSHKEAACLSVLGIGVSLLLYSMVIHNMYAKEFSLGLGLLAGADRWIWPRGFVDASSDTRTDRMLRAV